MNPTPQELADKATNELACGMHEKAQATALVAIAGALAAMMPEPELPPLPVAFSDQLTGG